MFIPSFFLVFLPWSRSLLPCGHPCVLSSLTLVIFLTPTYSFIICFLVSLFLVFSTFFFPCHYPILLSHLVSVSSFLCVFLFNYLLCHLFPRLSFPSLFHSYFLVVIFLSFAVRLFPGALSFVCSCLTFNLYLPPPASSLSSMPRRSHSRSSLPHCSCAFIF